MAGNLSEDTDTYNPNIDYVRNQYWLLLRIENIPR